MDDSRDGNSHQESDVGRLPDSGEESLPTTTAAEVESAGRSCMAILIMTAVIAVVLLVWIVFRSFGGGQ